jgi:hypothetical protein
MVTAGIISNTMLVIANRSVPCVDSFNSLAKVIRNADNSGMPSNNKEIIMILRVIKSMAKQMQHAEAGTLYRINEQHGYSKVTPEELLRLFNVVLYGKVKS